MASLNDLLRALQKRRQAQKTSAPVKAKLPVAGWKAAVTAVVVGTAAGSVYHNSKNSKNLCMDNPAAPACVKILDTRAGQGVDNCLYNPNRAGCPPVRQALGSAPAKEAKSGCQINPGTLELISQVDAYRGQISALQSILNSKVAGNPYSKCQNSRGAQAMQKEFGTVGWPNVGCRNNHTQEVHSLNSAKHEFYARLVVLKKDPACVSLANAVERNEIAMPSVPTIQPARIQATATAPARTPASSQGTR